MTIIKKRDIKPLIECDFTSNLDKTLTELGITRNALAIESKTRPLTINELESGKAKQINFSTLESILEALNRIAVQKGINKNYIVSDIFEYNPKQEDGE